MRDIKMLICRLHHSRCYALHVHVLIKAEYLIPSEGFLRELVVVETFARFH